MRRLLGTFARRAFRSLALALTCAAGLIPSDPAVAETGGTPRTFLLDLHNLSVSKQAWKEQHPLVTSDVNRLISAANRKLSAGPFSVTFTPEIAPSGDPHDLVSYGYYSWPNPNTPDGLPWIYRDGFGNSNNEVDWKQIYGLAQAAEPLSLAYYFTEDERYATKLAGLMRTFFLDEATRMNPRIEYSDMIPGVSFGSYGVPGFGNALGYHKLFDAAGILESSPSWTAADRAGLQKWARDFVRWSEFHPKGIIQHGEPSNHGTNYDFVATLLSLYGEDLVKAKTHFEDYAYNRLPKQVAADGSNPLEMLRANNLLYHRYNLSRVLDIAALGDQIDSIDLFTHELPDGRGLRDAVDYLTPYLTGQKNWDQWPGAPFDREMPYVYYELLRRAAAFYKDPALLRLADTQLGHMPVAYIDLTHPKAVVYENYTRGDANFDGQFNTRDLVLVFQAGLYDLWNDANWEQGDWNLDNRFNSADLVAAMQDGRYERVAAAMTVPEPTAAAMLAAGLLLLVARRSRASRADSID